MRFCKVCDKKIKQYQNKSRWRCGACNTKIRRYRAKIAAVKLKGGKCQKCGWTGNIAGFQFHHLDPSKKDFAFASCANKKWEVLKKELKKCILLCSNCHRILHANYSNKKFLEAVKNYKGRLFT